MERVTTGTENGSTPCYSLFPEAASSRRRIGRAHRSGMGPSKPRVAGSNPAGRAIFLMNSPIVPSASAPGAKV